MNELELRPAVRWFAEQMELKLRENDHKGGWLGIGMEYAQRRMREEALKLEDAILNFCGYHNTTARQIHESKMCIVREAADVANFAMMIADEWNPRQNEGDNASSEEERRD